MGAKIMISGDNTTIEIDIGFKCRVKLQVSGDMMAHKSHKLL
jgi:hypothetical protein